jgi:dipeptidyl aminopeptidase/acylaminoacyl peptidase
MLPKMRLVGATFALACVALPAAPALAVHPGADGVVVYASQFENPDTPRPLHVVNLDGTGDHVIGPATGEFYDPAVSPDGKKVAAVRQDAAGGDNVWVMNVDGSDLHPVNAAPTVAHTQSPAWAPDSQRLAYRYVPQVLGEGARPPAEVHVVNADGTGDRKLDTKLHGVNAVGEWAPDGSEISYSMEAGAWLADPNGGAPRYPGANAGVYAPDGAGLFQAQYGGVDLIARDGSNRRALVRGVAEDTRFAQPTPSGRLAWIKDVNYQSDPDAPPSNSTDMEHRLVITDAAGASAQTVGAADVSGGFDIAPVPQPRTETPSGDTGTGGGSTAPAPVPAKQVVAPKPVAAASCTKGRSVALILKLKKGAKVKGLKATVAGKRAKVARKGATVTVTLPKGGGKTAAVKVTAKVGGQAVSVRRTITRCG